MRNLTLLLTVCILFSCSGLEVTEYSDIKCVEDLKGHSVAVPMGSSYDLMLSDMGGVELVHLGLSELLVAVEKGRAEFCIMDQMQATLHDLPSRGLEIRFGDILKGKAAAGFRKSDSLICRQFNVYLNSIIESGEYDRWLGLWKHSADSMADVSFAVPEPSDPIRKLKVGITITYPYIFYKEGKLTGIETDLVKRFCLSAGYQAEFEINEFSSLIPALNTGKIDMIVSHMRKTQERARQILFTDAYIEGGGAAVCRSSNTLGVRKGLFERIRDSWHNNLVVEQRWKLMWNGLMVTLRISVFSILAGVLAGILLCSMRMSYCKVISKPAGVLIDLIRGIPLLVILMIMFYVVFASSRITGVSVAVLSFGVYYGAYFSEVFRMGMEGVERGQWEAGYALGLRKIQTFHRIVLPQALTRIIPVLKGELITLIKMTSVVGYVAVVDLTKAGDIIRSSTLDAFFPLLMITVVYILLSQLAGWGLDILNRLFTPKRENYDKGKTS